jgi:hypothetical protein
MSAPVWQWSAVFLAFDTLASDFDAIFAYLVALTAVSAAIALAFA